MLKGLGDLGAIMKMQKDMKSMQKRLKKATFEGADGDEKVKVSINGEYKVTAVSIDESLVSEGDSKKIAKSVMEAANNAMDRMKEFSAEEMQKITGGMDLSALGL